MAVAPLSACAQQPAGGGEAAGVGTDDEMSCADADEKSGDDSKSEDEEGKNATIEYMRTPRTRTSKDGGEPPILGFSAVYHCASRKLRLHD